MTKQEKEIRRRRESKKKGYEEEEINNRGKEEKRREKKTVGNQTQSVVISETYSRTCLPYAGCRLQGDF